MNVRRDNFFSYRRQAHSLLFDAITLKYLPELCKADSITLSQTVLVCPSEIRFQRKSFSPTRNDGKESFIHYLAQITAKQGDIG